MMGCTLASPCPRKADRRFQMESHWQLFCLRILAMVNVKITCDLPLEAGTGGVPCIFMLNWQAE